MKESQKNGIIVVEGGHKRYDLSYMNYPEHIHPRKKQQTSHHLIEDNQIKSNFLQGYEDSL